MARWMKTLSKTDLLDILNYCESQSKDIRKKVEIEYLEEGEEITSYITVMEYFAEIYDNIKIVTDYYLVSHPKLPD